MKTNRLIWFCFALIPAVVCEKNPAGFVGGVYDWDVSTPESLGMNPAMLDSALVRAGQTGFVDCLLVIRNGRIVAERYFNGYAASTPHDIKSVSKSFLSAITGIALERGAIDSLEEKMIDYFPEYDHPDLDPRKRLVTLRHLLTMRMGLRDDSEENYLFYRQITGSANWIKATLEAPLEFDPGQKMRYNTFETHLLSAILAKATGQNTFQFGQSFLCDPMDIDIDGWVQDPQGYYFGGNEMYFTPREAAVLGYLYLNDGYLNGLQIVPASWVALTLTASTNLPHPNSWGPFKNYNYGYLWWLGEINESRLFMGYGYGGQFVIVFPDLNLIVTTTAKTEIDGDTSTVQEWAIFDIVSKCILPAIRN